jgi:hypothetical protein
LTTIAALMALAFCCALAPAADASSTLLSGYGGPGQGNQAILGSTLIGGGGGSSSSSGGGAAPQVVTIEASASPSSGTGAEAGTGAAGRKTSGGKGHGHSAPRSASAGAPAGGQPATRQVVLASSSAPALGLSGGDWGYVVLALLVLAMTAFATVLLTRGSGAGHDGPGEMGSN